MSEFKHPYSKKESPYKVPENYFADKQSDLLDIAEDKTSKSRNTIRTWFITAAAAAVLAIAFFLWPRDGSVEPSADTIEEYLISEYTYMNTEEVLLTDLDKNINAQEDGWEIKASEAEDYLENNFDQTLYYEYY